MIPASIIYPDLLACAVATGDYWDDGSVRSRDNDFISTAPALTQAKSKRDYSRRFEKPEVLEHHRKVSRDYAKAHYVPAAQRQKLKAAAERVNADSALFAPVNHCGVASSAFASV